MMAEGAGQPIPESIATCFRQRLTTGGENDSSGMEQAMTYAALEILIRTA